MSIELNKPQTLANARKKIAQLSDARHQGDLTYQYAVASGWLSALRLEGLIDSSTFTELSAELNASHREIGATLADGPANH
ncbi:hypothetical protein ppKF707_4936 [Metapseudomonas furukawaii]|uniref:Uncharacterized protein n=2 Tax=Metapseudomonas furukawaii TaxID=1149133 RepID=L8MBK2_METFU|nr:hypothetical protein ppKF707_2255 [Pseudomonas furukawaii]ELS27564.1 hypothetical protein ppKF707_4936 [Pseudomonas furukawaii]BAU77443.1 hypothetical protein KF707C_p540 [Pseudomonas furukawaii]